MNAAFLTLGALALGGVWLVPWPQLLPGSFSVHMTRHMGLVAVAAPILALGVAGSRSDPVRRWPALFPPIAASLVEMAVIWTWHAPAFHHAAQHSAAVMVAEQASFLLTGAFVWLSALGGGATQRAGRSATGLVALLFTTMHMTLLGALLGLAPRPLYSVGPGGSAVLADQHLGGAIMLTVGGASYLAGGLWLAFELLRHRASMGSDSIDIGLGPGATGRIDQSNLTPMMGTDR